MECLVKIKKSPCCLCRYYKKGYCEGYYSTLIGNNGEQICKIPLLNEYNDNYFKELEMEIKKNGYITKQEVIQYTKEIFKEEITSRTLSFYVSQGLIEPGIVERFPGISGSVSFFKYNTPGIIESIILFKKANVTLKDLKRYFDILEFRDLDSFNYIRKRMEALKKLKKIFSAYQSEQLEDLVIEALFTDEELKMLNNFMEDIVKVSKLPLYSFNRIAKYRAFFEIKCFLFIYSGHKFKENKVEKPIKMSTIVENTKVIISPIDSDVDNLFIKVIFEDPYKFEVIFKRSGIEVLLT